MHNLHLARTRAASHQAAEQLVEHVIEGWGNENNWRTICGSVSEAGSVHDTGDGRWSPSDCPTIEAINEMMTRWVKGNDYEREAFDKLQELSEADLINYASKQYGPNYMELYKAKQYLEHLLQTSGIDRDAVNCLKDEMYAWKLDACGITDLVQEPEGDIYIVFIDMHS